MTWSDYEAWRAGDASARPEAALVDGALAGAVVSLRPYPDDGWIESIAGPEALSALPGTLEAGAVAHLRRRMTEIRSNLAGDENTYTPVLTVTDEGDFDMTAWSTGFIEAIGPDLETWTYVLAQKPEGGLLGLLGSYAVGPMGEAARARIAKDDDRAALLAARERSWEFIPQLMAVLYRKKFELADQSA